MCQIGYGDALIVVDQYYHFMNILNLHAFSLVASPVCIIYLCPACVLMSCIHVQKLKLAFSLLRQSNMGIYLHRD